MIPPPADAAGLLPLYSLYPNQPKPQPWLWQILLNPSTGHIIHVQSQPFHQEILGRILTPQEAMSNRLTPAELYARADALFPHRYDLGAYPRPAEFKEIIAQAGWALDDPAPGQPRLSDQICHAYGLPARLPRDPENPGLPPAQALSRLLADYNHEWLRYDPDPENPAQWRAREFLREPPEDCALQRPLEPPAALRPGDWKTAQSWRRRHWKDLKIRGHNKASARRCRENRVRAALGLHPCYGQIGPFKDPNSAHRNWHRKAKRDQLRAAAAAGQTPPPKQEQTSC